MTPPLAAAALMVRESDGRVLLAHHASGLLAGRWALPSRAIGRAEVAEQSLAHLLHDHLHVQPATADFAETLAVGSGDQLVVLNIFLALAWEGQPRFTDADYHDVQWVDPLAPGLPLDPALAEWLATAAQAAASGTSAVPDAADLTATLATGREALVAAYAAFTPLAAEARLDWDLDGGWAAVDVLAHSASVEAYYREETRRLLEWPSHTWRPFNDAQAEAERQTRPRPDERLEHERLSAVRAETLRWLGERTVEELSTYGNHPAEGVVRIGQQIARIARHDKAHADQLRTMLQAAHGQDQARAGTTEEGATDAVADR